MFESMLVDVLACLCMCMHTGMIKCMHTDVYSCVTPWRTGNLFAGLPHSKLFDLQPVVFRAQGV